MVCWVEVTRNNLALTICAERYSWDCQVPQLHVEGEGVDAQPLREMTLFTPSIQYHPLQLDSGGGGHRPPRGQGSRKRWSCGHVAA